jgi:hypothetical protein
MVPCGRQGTSSVQINVTDTSQPRQTAQATFSFTAIQGSCTNPLTITTTSLPKAAPGAWYQQPLAASGGSGPYTWSATGLPPGIALSFNGWLWGTPVCGRSSWGAQGTFYVHVKVTDASQSQQTALATIPLSIALTC